MDDEIPFGLWAQIEAVNHPSTTSLFALRLKIGIFDCFSGESFYEFRKFL